jgi:hypothetical protein
MEPPEIVELIRLINATYPNAKPITPLAEPVWNEDLGDMGPQQIRAAFTAWRRTEHAFPPMAADLRRLALELQESTPRFEHAWGAIQQAVNRHGSYCEAEAQQALRPVPMAWDLVTAMGGWRCICLGGPDEYEATTPGVWRSQAEHAWRALVEQRRTDLAVADIATPMPRVREANLRLAGLPQPVLAPLEPAFAVSRPALPEAAGPEPVRRIAERIVAATMSRPPSLKPEYRAEIEAAIREGREDRLPARWQPFVTEIKAALAVPR